MTSAWFDRLAFALLLALVLLAPIPLGSNRDWSWSLCALLAALLTLGWLAAALLARRPLHGGLPAWIALLFAAVLGWAWLQAQPWLPVGWAHPAWSMAAATLDRELAATVSLSPEDNATALMRLLSYALVFGLAFQLARDRLLARRALRWIFIAGAIYALYGLLSYWGVLRELGWYHDDAYGRDVRASFVNRNHFANWLGIALVCAMAFFYEHMMRAPSYPMMAMQSRQRRLDRFLKRAWPALAGLVLMVSALVSTHSRGGFIATFCGGLVLLLLIDRKQGTVSGRARGVVAAALLVSAAAFFITSEVLLQRFEQSDLDAAGRMEIYTLTAQGIADNPWLGFGYGAYEDAFTLYRSENVLKLVDRAHNSYLENLFELGLPAGLAFFAVLFGLGWVCLRGLLNRHRDWIYPAAGLAAGAVAAVHASVDFGMQIPATAMLFALVLGIGCAQSFSSRE